MRTKQNKSGLGDGADDRLTPQRSPLNPPAGAPAEPLGKANSYHFFEIAKRNNFKVWMHSCGFHRPILEDFLEIGVDIINPVPPYVKDSSPLELKKTYGSRLVLDGTVDHINVMTLGSKADVENEVHRRIDECAPGGGFIIGASQGFTDDVPMQNIVALYETALKYGHY